jgi:hypothetical protein
MNSKGWHINENVLNDWIRKEKKKDNKDKWRYEQA